MNTKHQHGGDINQFAKEIGCKVEEVIDLSSNINFIKPTININFNTLNIAPYPHYNQLESAIANLYQVKDSELALFNGATTAIYSLFRLLKLKEITLYAPLYGEYQKASELYGYNINLINRFDNIDQEIKEDSLIVFVNPSTPDGKYYNIDRLMKRWIEKKCTILIDESFLDFTPYNSVIPYLKTYNRLYILKSMTKFYAAAGIRIGAVLSNEQNIQKIESKEPLWKISEFDSHYLQSALKDTLFPQKAKEINDRNRSYIVHALEELNCIEKIYPSSANFILIQLKSIDAETLQKQLTKHKITIRNCKNFDFLDNSFVRIAIKDIIALKTLEQTLCKISILV